MTIASLRRRATHIARSLPLTAVVLVIVGCAGAPTVSPTAPSGAPSTASAAASSASAAPTAAPSGAAPTVAAVCLPPDVLAAIGELARGDLDPSVPRDEMADAIEAIDPDEIDHSLVPIHDALVNMLRKAEVRDSSGTMAQRFLDVADGRIGAC